MANLAVEDLNRLEQEPAYKALLDEARAVKVELLESNAKDIRPGDQALVERAERLGEVAQINYLLLWTDKERKKIKNAKLAEVRKL